jgi:hypothetical protein
VVVVVDIKEDVVSLRRNRKTTASLTRVRRLAQRFGNLKGMEKLGVKPHSSQEESDEDLYESLR